MPKNDFTRKMIDLETYEKIAQEVGDLGKLIVAKGFKRPIWSHCLCDENDGTGGIVPIFNDISFKEWAHFRMNCILFNAWR